MQHVNDLKTEVYLVAVQEMLDRLGLPVENIVTISIKPFVDNNDETPILDRLFQVEATWTGEKSE